MKKTENAMSVSLQKKDEQCTVYPVLVLIIK